VGNNVLPDGNGRSTVVVLVFLEKEGKILLVRQDYGKRYWSLPGGVMEPGESIEQAAVREVKEETGLDIRVVRVVGLYSKPTEYAIAVTLEGEILGGWLQPANEISECGFFPADQLPTPIRDHLRERIADFQRQIPAAILRTQ
jgi:ADP-ribose pyrophosphatase YjhB (NUDIX family)